MNFASTCLIIAVAYAALLPTQAVSGVNARLARLIELRGEAAKVTHGRGVPIVHSR